MAYRRRVGGLLAGVAVLLIAPVAAQDWPQWRGPNRDGAIASFNPPSSWPERLARQWQVDVGLGYATPLVVGTRLYLFTRQGEEEVMQALDASSGKPLWRTSYRAPFEMNSSTARHRAGPKSTPAYAGGRLFTLGMSSIVTAFDAATGKQLWQKPATKAQPAFHTAMSPLVDGDRVIIHVGGPGDTALTAFDVATGEPRWRWTGDSPAYGSPIAVELAGTRQIVTFTHKNLVGVSAATGALLWSRPFSTPSDTTSQTPLLHKDTVIQAGRENGFVAFRVVRKGDGYATEDVWRTDQVSQHMTNGVAIDGVLYRAFASEQRAVLRPGSRRRESALDERPASGGKRRVRAGGQHDLRARGRRGDGRHECEPGGIQTDPPVRSIHHRDLDAARDLGEPGLREGRVEPHPVYAQLTPTRLKSQA